MEHGELTTNGVTENGERTRRAVLALWAIPGLGPVTLANLEWRFGKLADLLDVPVTEWLEQVDVANGVRERLLTLGKLTYVADVIEERAAKAGILIAHAGDPAYPERLVGIPQQPPLLFYKGTVVGQPRRRIAMVGTRHPDERSKERAVRWARDLAARGLGIVSGAAIGIDQACHRGALAARGETWAFLGSALDQIDSAQREIVDSILTSGGCIYSELPPGMRANTQTFPRRNRLISGASDAVLVLRAGERSGALRTATYAEQQGRPLLAWPGDLDTEHGAGTNKLIRDGAGIALSIEDAVVAVGLKKGEALVAPSQGERADVGELSEEARVAYRLLRRSPQAFEEIHAASEGMEAGALLSALMELELFGLALQRPGKIYEKV